MSIRIFHTADVHIGLKFISRDYPQPVRERLIDERFNVLERMIEYANGEDCSLFVIAGDLFDNVNIPLKHVKRTAEILNRFRGDYLIVLPGNHDFWDNTDGKIWKLFTESVDKAPLLFLKECRKYELEIGEFRINLYPGPCDSKHSAENKIKWILNEPLDVNAVNIGIAHGAVAGISPDNDDKYFLMGENELQDCGTDLWLLGHTHIQIPGEGLIKPLFFMPSTPEPDGFDCSHQGGAFKIEIDGNKNVSYSSIRTGKLRFLTVETAVNSLEEMERVKTELEGLDTQNILLKLKLKGRLSSEEKSRLKDLEQTLNEKFLYYEFVNEVALNITKDFIDSKYPENSLPYLLLNGLIEDNEDPSAVNLAYDLIEEAGK